MTTPDRAHGSDLAAVSFPARGAFLVNEGALKDIESMLRRFASRGEVVAPVQVVVEFVGADRQEFIGCEPVIALRNAKAAPIRTITLATALEASQAQVRLDSTGAPDWAGARLFAQDDSPDRLSALAGDFDREVRNIRDSWNSWHRSLVDRVLAWTVENAERIGKAMLVIAFVAMCFVGLAAIVGGLLRERAPIEPPTGTVVAPPVATTPAPVPPVTPRVEPPSRPIRQSIKLLLADAVDVLTGVALGALVLAVIVGYARLFPRVTFQIGEGKQRSDHLSKVRWFVVGSILVSGVVLPWAKGRVTDVLRRPPVAESAPPSGV